MFFQTFLQLVSGLCIVSSCGFALIRQVWIVLLTLSGFLTYTQMTGIFFKQSTYNKSPSLLCSHSWAFCCIHPLSDWTWLFRNGLLVFETRWESSICTSEWALATTGLTYYPTQRETIKERKCIKLTYGSEEVSKEIPHRFVFVCISGAGVCADSRIAFGIPYLFWLLHLQQLHGRGRAQLK